MDFCPNARILLVACKTDLRTDMCTLMELSAQKMAPISHEQVSYIHLISIAWSLLDLFLLSPCLSIYLHFLMALSLGLFTSKAGGSRGISGVFRIYVGEKHSQFVSFSSTGLSWQTSAAYQAKSRLPETPPAPVQQDWVSEILLQQREDQELFCYVSQTFCFLGQIDRRAVLKGDKRSWLLLSPPISTHSMFCVFSYSIPFLHHKERKPMKVNWCISFQYTGLCKIAW